MIIENPCILAATTLVVAYLLDRMMGDPMWLPHPVVWFGKAIASGERLLNKGSHRVAKGGMLAIVLILATYGLTQCLLLAADRIFRPLTAFITVMCTFYCLAGTTLIREVEMTFEALDRSLDDGRKQVARIVGRDTSELSAQEVRAAALETLSENLSDGVIAPLFWFGLLGVPGMMAYKMVNTLDSMIAYHSERYLLFGRVAARIDDAANYIPARLTALLMVIVAGKPSLISFVAKYGRCHASPNSGYPESALAGILNCRFGGTHTYFGEVFHKPYIGENARPLATADMHTATRVNELAAVAMLPIAWAMRCAVIYWF